MLIFLKLQFYYYKYSTVASKISIICEDRFQNLSSRLPVIVPLKKS